jgi:hypothetical protein
MSSKKQQKKGRAIMFCEACKVGFAEFDDDDGMG